MGSRMTRIGDWDLLASKAGYDARQLASICQISIRQLERFFRQSFESSPQAWLNRVRLSVAQQLLMQGLTVKETAYRLGFKQPSHFCRQFRHFTGCTPNNFGALRSSSLPGDVAARPIMSLRDNSAPLTCSLEGLMLGRARDTRSQI
jgi:AraC-like DNA-binding protein